MHDNSPYPLKGVDHLSASAIKDYCNCEALGAYRRNFIGVAKVALGIYFAFGIVAHKINEMMGRYFWSKVSKERRPVTPDELKKWLNFSRAYIMNVMEEKWGARGRGEEVIPLSWMPTGKKKSLSPQEYKLEVERLKNTLVGKMYNAVAAVGLEFTEPMPYVDMKFEVEFSSKNILMSIPFANFPPLKLDGQIDRIQFYEDGSYEELDYKTGRIINKYDRAFLVDDIQMTIYDYAGLQIFGYQPRGMYIQGLEISTEDRKQLGASVLKKQRYRREVPKRVQTHYDDIALLSADISQMIELIVNRHLYSQTELKEWVPDSSYGRKAGFAESVTEGYFKPRIGEWCTSCPYFELCPADHPRDWENAGFKEEILETPEPFRVPVGVLAERQMALFEREATRTKNKTKRKIEIREELVATGNFVPLKTLRQNKSRSTVTGLIPYINKFCELIQEHGLCDCVDTKLLPWEFVVGLPELAQGKITLKELLSKCPNPNCSRKHKEDKKLEEI